MYILYVLDISILCTIYVYWKKEDRGRDVVYARLGDRGLTISAGIKASLTL